MSWQVDGTYYHNHDEYLRAQAARDLRQVRTESETLSRRARDLQDRVRQREEELEQARGDARRQMQINQSLGSDVRELRQVMDRLGSAQRAAEQRSQEEFERVREQLKENADDVAELERHHRDHVNQVRQEFQQHRQAMEQGFAEAERRRDQTERKLQAEISEVNAKVEEDRQLRLSREGSALDRAAAQIRFVDDLMQKHASDAASVRLEKEFENIRLQVQEARRLVEEGRAESSLGLSSTAFTGLQALTFEINRRQAEMEGAREMARSGTAYVRQLLETAELSTYYRGERARLIDKLDRLDQRTANSYRNYNSLALEADRDQTSAKLMEEAAIEIVTLLPDVIESIRDRQTEGKKVLLDIAKIYGRARKVTPKLEDPADLKSPLIIECEFSGATVIVQSRLNGHFTADSFGHPDNGTCQEMGKQVIGAIRTHGTVNSEEFSATNRAVPMNTAPRASLGDAISGIERKLQQIDQLRI